MNETLNKKALIDSVCSSMDFTLTKKDATSIVDAVFEEITNALANGDKVDISGFGKFEISERPARMGINPSTKEPLQIAASKAPKFRAAKALKEAVK